MEKIPTIGDRILRGKSLEVGRTEVEEVGDGGENNSEGEENIRNKGQQRLMQNWMRGNVQNQDREDEQRQTNRQDNKREQKQHRHQEGKKHEKDKLQSRHQGEDQLLQHQNGVKETEQHYQTEQKEGQRHRAEIKNCRYTAKKQKLEVGSMKVKSLQKVKRQKGQGKITISSWLTTLLLLVRYKDMITNQEGGEKKSSNEEDDCAHKEKVQGGTESGTGKRSRTGVG